jgi:hypothetical protein
MDAEAARFIARRRNYAACPRAADGDRLAAQRGIVALLDGREKRIHIDMENAAKRLGRFAALRHAGRELSKGGRL